MHRVGFVPLDEMRRVAVPLEQLPELFPGDPGQEAGIGDLVAVQVQDRHHGTVARRVEELVRVPARGQRSGLGLAVADDARDDQVRVVEGGAVGVREGIAQLTPLVDRPGRLRGDVARDAAGEAELREQPLYPVLILADVGVDLAVGPLQVDVGDYPRSPVPGADDVDHVQVMLLDDPIEVDVDEVEPGGCPPVAEQPRLDMLSPERLLQERVVEEVDLSDREVIGGPPVGVNRAELLGRERGRLGLRLLRISRRLAGRAQSWCGIHRSTPGWRSLRSCSISKRGSRRWCLDEGDFAGDRRCFVDPGFADRSDT